MRKFLLLILFTTMMLPVVFSQAVVKGNFEAGAGTGFGLFQLTSNDTNDATSLALSGVLQGHFEYAPINKISLGIMFQRNGFATDRDSGNSAQTYLLGAGLKYRAVNAENTVIYFSLTGGPSWMHYFDKSTDNYLNGQGYWFDLCAGTRYYITHKAGIFVELSYVKKQITHFKDKNDNLLMVGPYTDRREFDLTMGGMNLRFGLNFKFGGNNGKS